MPPNTRTMTDMHAIRKAELARLRAAQTGAAQQREDAAPLAPAGVSERNRADIRARIDAIEAQMRAQWAAPAAASVARP